MDAVAGEVIVQVGIGGLKQRILSKAAKNESESTA
jgi:hypothetical protein